MTLSPPLLLVVLLVPALLGAGVARAIGLRAGRDGFAFAAWSWLLGAFATAGLLLLALVLDAPRAWWRWLPVVATAALWIALFRRSPAPRWIAVAPSPRDPPGAGLLLHVAVAICLVTVVREIVQANHALIVVGDEANIWSGKAKALWVSGGFNEEYRRLVSPGPGAYLDHADYPLLNPLLHLWTFAWAGGITHVDNRLPIQAFAVVLVLLLASAARRVAPAPVAAAGVLLVGLCALFQEASRYAAADLMVAGALLGALDAWSRHRAGDPAALRLFALLLATLAWSKNEGIMLAVVVAVAALGCGVLRRPRLRPRALSALGPLALVVAVQLAHNAAFDLGNDLVSADRVDHQGVPLAPGPIWERIAAQAAEHAPVIWRFVREHGVLRPAATNLILALFLVMLVLFPLRAAALRPVTTATLLLAMLGFALVYLGTPRGIEWHLTWSIDRVLLQLVPAAGLWLCAAAADLASGTRPADRMLA